MKNTALSDSLNKLSGKSPFFSVIICTYNRAGIIGRALDSLAAQTMTDWEGVIIDDGSEDDTRTAVQPYLRHWPLRYIQRPHAGCAVSKNAGMQAAEGHYITFLDTDDTYLKDHLQIRKAVLTPQADIDLLHSDVTIIGDPYVPDKEDPARRIHIRDCVVGGTFCIKRSSLGPTDRFLDRYSDDSFFLEQFRREGKHIAKIAAPTYCYYRQGSDSICNRQGS